MFRNIDVKFLLKFKFANHRTKQPFVSPANKALVGTLITIGDVIDILAIVVDNWHLSYVHELRRRSPWNKEAKSICNVPCAVWVNAYLATSSNYIRSTGGLQKPACSELCANRNTPVSAIMWFMLSNARHVTRSI